MMSSSMNSSKGDAAATAAAPTDEQQQQQQQHQKLRITLSLAAASASTTTASPADGDDEQQQQEQQQQQQQQQQRYRDLYGLPSHARGDVMAVPANIGRKGLSVLVNHLLDRHSGEDEADEKKTSSDDDSDNGNDSDDDSDKLPYVPFEFIVENNSTPNNAVDVGGNNNTNNKLLRASIERESRRLGLSLENVVRIQYFPAAERPVVVPTSQDDDDNTLPDWISCLSATNIVKAAGNEDAACSVVTASTYDGSIHLFRTTDTKKKQKKQDHSDDGTAGNDTGGGLVKIRTLDHHHVQHEGPPIKCMKTVAVTASSKQQPQTLLWIASGAMVNNDDDDPNSLTLNGVGIDDPTDDSGASSSQRNNSSSRTTIACVDGHVNSTVSCLDYSFLSSTPAQTNNNGMMMASGDFDGNVCIWDLNKVITRGLDQVEDEDQPTSSKRSKKQRHHDDSEEPSRTTTSTTTTSSSSTTTITPTLTFQAHTSNISGISWGTNYEKKLAASSQSQPNTNTNHRIITGSFDHGVKLWDLNHHNHGKQHDDDNQFWQQNCIMTMNKSRVITCLDTSWFTSDIAVTGHPDCVVRLWDLRLNHASSDTGGNKENGNTGLFAASYDNTLKPSHKDWISAVAFSSRNPYHLYSTSYDQTIKLWDLRASLPIYTIRTKRNAASGARHRTTNQKEEDKNLCLALLEDDTNDGGGDHSRADRIFVGGTDCIVKQIYR